MKKTAKLCSLLSNILAWVLCAGALSLWSFGRADGAVSTGAPAAGEAAGTLILSAEDGITGAPLPGVTIVIPEMDLTVVTGDDGTVDPILVPIMQDTLSRYSLERPWGEITLLSYKEGYLDGAIFHVQVWENQTRQGPTLLLFPLSSSTSDQPLSLVEGPHRLWVNALLDAYRPRQEDANAS